MRTIVREASIQDAPGLRNYMQELWEESLNVMYRQPAPPTLEEEQAFVKQLSSSCNSLLLIAVDGDAIVGMLDLHGMEHPQRRHVARFGMSVAQGYRRKGLGRALIEAMLDKAADLGLSRIELQVFENNAPAIRLYQDLGFEVEGRNRRAVAVNDELIDVLSMAKAVKPSA